MKVLGKQIDQISDNYLHNLTAYAVKKLNASRNPKNIAFYKKAVMQLEDEKINRINNKITIKEVPSNNGFFL